MAYFYAIHGKHDPAYFRTAVGAVKFQIEEMYQYLDDSDPYDAGVLDRARLIVAAGDETAALRLLRKRAGGEYEDFRVESFVEDRS